MAAEIPRNDEAAPPPAWHARPAESVLEALGATEQGLSTEAWRGRLEQHGPNRLTPPKSRPAWLRLLLQFHNVLIYVLLAAALLTAFLQHWVDTGVIIGVVIVNALIGFIQEGKAEKALEAIRQMLSPQATVLRDGHPRTVPAQELVPGDVVLLQSGDRVPADLRLFRVKDLRIDESLLTGESVPVEKAVDPVREASDLGDRRCMAYSGTLVTYGQGRAVVVATGDATEIGRISGLLGTVEHVETPLLRQMAQFGRWLTVAIVALAGLTVAFGVWVRGYSLTEMFLAAVGLAVAAIPEGLPAIMTITLAIGVQRMARRNAIIRVLPAVETLGSVSVICSDKTGTLTRNEMTVQSVLTAGGAFEVTGTGYEPLGEFRMDGVPVRPADHPVLEEIARAGLLCNEAAVAETPQGWVLHGDPTEGALVTLALKAGLDQARQQEQWPRLDVIPFESEHRFMATLHHDHAGHAFVYVKGAPERILSMCGSQRAGGRSAPLEREYWERGMEELAARGQRLLAVAFKPLAPGRDQLRFEDVEDELTLLGIVGIIDPPREEAVRAIEACHGAGIRVKMITGDHALTAVSIGRQMGIGDGRTVLSGHEIEDKSDEELEEVAARLDVFARASPEHKLRLVRALQARGQVVAMTGDGVNDAPALKRADVGVAMGRKGTEVAKEAAEMVLADDNFASIANAVEEGRTVYDNLKKAILFILPTNGGEAFTLVAAILLGRALPITPVQILWVNMITAVTLALALAFEPAEPGVMARPPRAPREPLLSALLVWRIVFVSAVLVAGTFGLFVWEREAGASLEAARTVAVNTLVCFEIFYLFNARYIYAPVLNRSGLLGNRKALAAVGLLILFQLGFTYLPPAQRLFHTVALEPEAWLRIVAVASSVLWMVELEKLLVGRRRAGG